MDTHIFPGGSKSIDIMFCSKDTIDLESVNSIETLPFSTDINNSPKFDPFKKDFHKLLIFETSI